MLQEDVLYTRDKVTQFVAIFEIMLKNQKEIKKEIKEIKDKIKEIKK